MKRSGINLDVLTNQETAGSDRRDSIYISRQEQAKNEYERIKGLIQNSDPTKIELLDGLIWEAAKARALTAQVLSGYARITRRSSRHYR